MNRLQALRNASVINYPRHHASNAKIGNGWPGDGVGIQVVHEMECPVGIVGRFDAAGDGRVGRYSLTA